MLPVNEELKVCVTIPRPLLHAGIQTLSDSFSVVMIAMQKRKEGFLIETKKN